MQKVGVLFVDEAYALYSEHSDGYESEAIATLIKELEDKRDNLCVIFARIYRWDEKATGYESSVLHQELTFTSILKITM